MSRCPVCQSVRIVMVLGATRRAFCTRCGTRWVQQGAEQRAVEALQSRRSSRVIEPLTSSPGSEWAQDGANPGDRP
jgi:hypothetical protein